MTRLEAEIEARVWGEAADSLKKSFKNIKINSEAQSAFAVTLGFFRGREIELDRMAKTLPQEPYR